MKGFGSYKYCNWAAGDEFGEYRKNFNVPADWAGRRVFLVYEGSMAETETRVNGIPAGFAGGGSATALENDRAIDNSASTAGGNGGVVRSSAGNINLGTRTAFTMCGWIKPPQA